MADGEERRRPSWDEYFMRIAHEVAKRSTCLRRSVGALVVLDKRILATGYNGAPSGLPHCSETGCLREQLNVPSGERHELCRGLHAEMNALLQGARHRVRELQEGTDFLVLEPLELKQLRRNRAPIAVGALVLAILLVVFADFHISLAMLIAAVIMILTGCLSIEEAHESIDWRTVFLVAGMLPLGMAMEATGTAQYLANIMVDALGDFGSLALLAGTYLLAALITQAMSNAAAMVLIVPIAVDTALGLGANYITFTMAVVIGAATSFLSPVGHKANVLVFGPGGYRFFDYARVGALLTVALLIVSMIFLPLFWPLFP